MARTSFGLHAYWRAIGGQTGMKQGYVAYSAMGFRDPSASTITASGGTALANATFPGSGGAPGNLFDGTDATFWESTSTDGVSWCGYHFASDVEVMQIGMQKAGSMDGSFPGIFVLFQYSDDGVTWVTVGEGNVSAVLAANDTMYWFDFAVGL